MPNDTWNMLFAVLEQEKALLLRGNAADAAELEARKLELVAQLEHAPNLSPQDLNEVRKRLQRNHELLGAISKGVKAAQTRLSDIRRVMNQLDTYTRQGDRMNIQNAAPNVERRA